MNELRESFTEAVRAGVDAPRNASNKWDTLYDWFTARFGISGGEGGVIGKVITERKQVGNRIDEMARWDPAYAVIATLNDVQHEHVLSAMRARRLPSLRAVLLLDPTLRPRRLVTFGDQPLDERWRELAPGVAVENLPPLNGLPVTAPATAGSPPPRPGALSHAAIPIVLDPRIERMVRLAILSSNAVILVGPPGTGKTTLLRRVVEQIAADPPSYGFEGTLNDPLWATPEESWTTHDLVGGTTVDDGKLRFRPGLVVSAIEDDRWLILDELNRADMDRIFGALLTWLSDQPVTVGRVSTSLDAPEVVLGWTDSPHSSVATEGLSDDTSEVTYLAGTQWRLLGTYNAVDAQRVFRFGQAIGRRFVRVPIPPPTVAEFTQVVAGIVPAVAPPVAAAIVGLYAAHTASTVTELGPALFLRMVQYVNAGLDTQAEPMSGADDTADGEDGLSRTQRELLAEAYLVNVGTWLTHFAEEVDALGDRIVDEHHVFDRDEWAWILQLSRALG